MGIITKRDEFTIRFDPEEIWTTVTRVANTSVEMFRSEFGLPKDSDWTAANAKKDVGNL
jgi:hypothetical protein